jgi:hypothetical protein
MIDVAKSWRRDEGWDPKFSISTGKGRMGSKVQY